MNRVLVTGGTGFIGRHAVPRLVARGFDVHVASRRQACDHGASWHRLDLLDPAATSALVREVEPSHLLHVAWYAEHGRFWEAPENLDWTAASLHLLRCFADGGGRRAVVAGTCAEYDWSADCCSPETPLRPATLYGVSKNALREIAESFARRSGIQFAWGRVFFTYGPAEQPARVVASVARALVEGREAVCSSGDQIRDFLYVEDVADALVALLDSDVSGAVDIGSGAGVSLRDVLLRLGRLSGRPHLVRLGAMPPRREPRRIVAWSPRLQEELGWAPAYGLDEGLLRTLEWWRSRVDRPSDPAR